MSAEVWGYRQAREGEESIQNVTRARGAVPDEMGPACCDERDKRACPQALAPLELISVLPI